MTEIAVKWTYLDMFYLSLMVILDITIHFIQRKHLKNFLLPLEDVS